jgi:hypothetical protein
MQRMGVEELCAALQSGPMADALAAAEELERRGREATMDATSATVVSAERAEELVAALDVPAQAPLAALALGLLARNAGNKRAIAAAGAIAPLVSLVREGDAGGKQQAAFALSKLSNSADAAVRVAGAEAPLRALAASGSPVAQGYAWTALRNMH